MKIILWKCFIYQNYLTYSRLEYAAEELPLIYWSIFRFAEVFSAGGEKAGL